MGRLLMTLGFTKSKVDSNVCFKVEGRRPVILLLYNLFLIGKEELIRGARKRLAVKFEIKDLGMMNYFLDMEVWQNADGISLEQGNYVVEILKRFGMMECKSTATPMALDLKLLSDAS